MWGGSCLWQGGCKAAAAAAWGQLLDVSLCRVKGSVMEEEEGKLGGCWKSTTSVDFSLWKSLTPLTLSSYKRPGRDVCKAGAVLQQPLLGLGV